VRSALPATGRPFDRGTASSGLTWLGRAGFVAKGVVYTLLGLLAFEAALEGGRPRDEHGAVDALGAQPFGEVLLVLVGIGLFAYSGWRLFQAFVAADPLDGTLKRTAGRIAHVGSSLVHAGLAVAAFQLAAGDHAASGEHSARSWAGRVLEQPFGETLLFAVGAGILIAAGAQFVEAVLANFRHTLELSRAGGSERCWLVRFGRIGHAARGVVFAIIGVFAMRAALASDAGQVKGFAGALRRLQTEPYGAMLLALVALGLAIYGLFMLVSARFVRARVP
jgi:hypothetical protein